MASRETVSRGDQSPAERLDRLEHEVLAERLHQEVRLERHDRPQRGEGPSHAGSVVTLGAPPEPPIYDRPDQLEKIRRVLIPGEYLHAVYDMRGGGTGFLGITSKRLIVYDKAFLRKMKAVVTIPYSRIVTLAAEDEAGLFAGTGFFATSKLVVTTSQGGFVFAFRGADRAQQAHAFILRYLL
jgi:hypothetical protein